MGGHGQNGIMEEIHLKDPRVEPTVREVVRKKLGMFAKFHCIDADSLYADLIGEVAKASYNPEKSAPHTFAQNVAQRRAIDIYRRFKNALHSAQPLDTDELYSNERADPSTMEDEEDMLAEKIRKYYSMTLSYSRANIPVYIGPGRPPLITFAQKAALVWLMQSMGWGYRRMAATCLKYHSILEAIDLDYCPRYTFFHRAKCRVAELKKKVRRSHLPAAA